MKSYKLIIGLLVLTVVLTSGCNSKPQAVDFIRRGNQQYQQENYQPAVKLYQQGLKQTPKSNVEYKLRYNLGNSFYQQQNYQQAVAQYKKLSANKDKFLNLGNSYTKLGNKAHKTRVKIKHYQQAIGVYKQGIKDNPWSKKLKFNYEFVKRKLDKLKEQQQKQQQNNKRQDNQKDNQQQKTKNNQQQEQNQNEEQQNKDQQNSQQKQAQKNSQQDTGQKKKEDQAQKKNQSPQQGEKNKQEKLKEALRILRALEKQEQDSLQNNQQIKIKQGKPETGQDW